MAITTFLTLPPEIHVDIASYCDTSDLHNLCLTSKLMNQWFIGALYRHVDLQLDPDDDVLDGENSPKRNMWKRQEQFVRTLRSHPEYGKHVRSLKINDNIPCIGGNCLNNVALQVDFWRAMQSLTHVQSVDLQSSSPRDTKQGSMILPHDLFQSATSVRLAGSLQHGLAKLILNAIDPATLKHLCLDLVEEYKTEQHEDMDISFRSPPPGLLTTLTGRCTALRTLILRRIGHHHIYYGRHPTSFRWQVEVDTEEESYFEWASFIRSVQGMVKEFTFELVRPKNLIHRRYTLQDLDSRDERFLRLILPTILSGDWPCLTVMELRGVGAPDFESGEAALIMQLKAVLGGESEIVVESAQTLH